VRTRWRRPEEIGVEVVPLKASPAPVPIGLARKIKRLETENAALRRQLADLSE